MRILFIKPKHIGDSLVLTPTIAAAKAAYPEAEIWVAVRKGCDGILAGCPQIDRVITLAGVERSERHWSQLWGEVKLRLWMRRFEFDWLFELGDGERARWFSALCRAKKKCSVKPSTPLSRFWRGRFDGVSSFDWEGCHRVEKDFYSVHEFLPLALPVPPMVFEKSRAAEWAPAQGFERFCVMHVGSRQKANRWHAEGWIQAGRHLLTVCPRLIISTGPAADETEEANRIAAALGPGAVCTLGKTNWAEMAGLLYRAEVFVTLNTAAMHLAAACQCPTAALLGPSIEDLWRPWRSPHEIVTKPGFERAPGPAGFPAIRQRPMGEIRAEDVIAACERLRRSPQSRRTQGN